MTTKNFTCKLGKTDHFYCLGQNKLENRGGAALHRGSILASRPAAPGLILYIPMYFSLYVDEIY